MAEAGAVSTPAAPATALPLFETAALAGAYRWIERRLFELTGRWSAGDGPAPVRVHLAGRSAQHAWHAELWADRLPVLAGVDHEALTRPPDEATARLLGALGDLPGSPAPLAGQMAGLHRVVAPRLMAAYEWHLERTVAVSDGPVARVLRLVIDDGRRAHQAGLAVLKSLLRSDVAQEEARAAERQLAGLADAVGAGGRLVAWPVPERPDPSPGCRT